MGSPIRPDRRWRALPDRGASRGAGRCTVSAVRQQVTGLPPGRLCAVRAGLPGLCRARVDACGPKSPDFHRVVWGLTSRPPGSPAGFPPVSRLPAGFFPFARLRLVSLRLAFSGCSLRPQPGSGSPSVPLSVSLRFPFPWAILTLALPRGGSAGVGPGRQGPRSPVPPRPPHVDRATAGTTGERLVTTPFRYIVARQVRLRTPDIDAPQSRRTAGRRAFSRTTPVTQRHTSEWHHSGADSRSSPVGHSGAGRRDAERGVRTGRSRAGRGAPPRPGCL